METGTKQATCPDRQGHLGRDAGLERFLTFLVVVGAIVFLLPDKEGKLNGTLEDFRKNKNSIVGYNNPAIAKFLVKQLGGKVVREDLTGSFLVVELPKSITLTQLKKLAADKSVRFVEPDYPVSLPKPIPVNPPKE